MRDHVRPGVLIAALSHALLLFSGCGKSTPPGQTGVDAGAGTDNDTGAEPIAITLSESAFTLATPDVHHGLTATVTGTATTTVTWSSSDLYIANVSPGGVVTSVSGGEAMITATAMADATKTATCKVTVAEPDRAKAATYTDAKTITSGPVRIIMAGDSLTRTYAANSADQAGWGQVLAQFLTSDAAVDNTLANGGRSSRSFYNELGRWDQVKQRLTAAKAAGVPAFVFIMFGHNDQKKVTDTDGPDYLTFASQNQNGTVAGTYYDYLERNIVETRDLGGIPVLFTPFVRQYLAGSPRRSPPSDSTTSCGERGRDRRPRRLPGGGEGDRREARRPDRRHHVVEQDDGGGARRRERARLRLHLGRSDARQELGALLMAEEAVRALNAQGILTGHASRRRRG